MSNSVKITLVAICLFGLSFTHPTKNSTLDCSILKEGTFKYKDDLSGTKIIIKNNKHKEIMPNGTIKSQIKWIDDCSYTMTIKKVSIKDSPLKKGTSMTVKINKVVGKEITYTANFNGIITSRTLIKQ